MSSEEFKRLFSQVARKEPGGQQKLEEIEARLAHLREGATLSYEDLEIIADPQYWPFSKHWMWPHRSQIESALLRTEGWFKDLPAEEKKIIRGLDLIFKNISLVSIILRFAVPEHYAIYSRPPLQILRIERGKDDVEEYLNYVGEMRILRDSFWVKKTSEVDEIVWAIFHLKGKYADELKRILAKCLPENLTAEELIIYLSQDPLKIARQYLKKNDHMTAGFWAAKAFEKFLDDECRNNGISIPDQAHKRAKMINALWTRTSLWKKPGNRQLLYDTKEVRNKIVPGVKNFYACDIEEFISDIESLKRIAMHNGQKQ